MGERFEPALLESMVRRFVPGKGPVHTTRITTGKFNTSFFVRANDGEYVLRIAPGADGAYLFYERGMMRQEPIIHALVREKTRVPVAEIIGCDDSRKIVDRDFILMERLPGKTMSESAAADEDAILRAVGAALAQVHGVTGFEYGYIGPHRPMPPQPEWVDAFQVMWRMLLDDIVAIGRYTDRERTFFIKLLDRHLRLFDRHVPASLLHMDVWSQNIMVSDAEQLTGIVDWDRALWGDVEIEFAVLDYCGISQPAFWEGYGRPRDESREARIRGVFYTLYEIQKYIVIYQGRTHQSQRASEYKEYARQLAAEIA